jgi:aminomethyltransferase
LKDFGFMTTGKLNISGLSCHVSRSGYTGEDGFEIQVASKDAVKLAEMLLHLDGVKWAGLGARDTLRLEAGMCLYGHDLEEDITPVEAGLTWTIGKRRRNEGGFLGSKVVLDQLKNGVSRRRIGLIVEGAPARGTFFSFNY